MLELPARTVKPRVTGLTCINDTGTPCGELADRLADYGSLVDIVKLGIGSAYVTPNLDRKLDLYRRYAIPVYFGGTLFEKFYHQNKLNAYLDYLRKRDIHHIEISNGTIELPLDQRVALTKQVKGEFIVIAEVGCKDQQTIMPPSQWIKEMKALLEAGAAYVIAEGRDSGTAGIYRESGEIRSGLVSDILDSVGGERVIFEAPKARDQMFLVKLAGSNVNLGNIHWQDVLVLETERQALRYETFHIGTT